MMEYTRYTLLFVKDTGIGMCSQPSHGKESIFHEWYSMDGGPAGEPFLFPLLHFIFLFFKWPK